MADVAIRNVGAVAEGATTTVTPTIPTGTQVGDLMLLVCYQRKLTATGMSCSAGWTEDLDIGNDASYYSTTIYSRIFVAGDGNPTVTSSGSGVLIAVIISLYNTAASSYYDVAIGNDTFAAPTTPFTVTITGFNTGTDGAMAFFIWESSDDNTWDYLEAGGATQRVSYNDAGASCSFCIATKAMATAGGTGNQSATQTNKAGDSGRRIWFAIEPLASTGRTGNVTGVCAQVTGAVSGDVAVAGEVAGTTTQVTGAVASKVAVAGAVAAIAAQATAAVAMNHTPATGSVDADVAAVTGVVAGAVLVTGEVAATPGVTTGALAGAVLVSGEIAATAAQVTAAVDGSVGAGAITGTVEAVAAQTIAALAGAVAIAGEIAATLAPVTGAVAGGAIVSGTVAANALQTTAAVAGAARVSGSVSAPVAQTTGAVAGAVAITGDVDATASQVTAVLSGGTADVIRGTIAANVSQIVAAIEGDVLVSGSVNATLVAASAAAAGTVTDAPAEDLNVYIRVPGREVVNYYHRVDNVRITVP